MKIKLKLRRMRESWWKGTKSHYHKSQIRIVHRWTHYFILNADTEHIYCSTSYVDKYIDHQVPRAPKYIDYEYKY